MAPNEDGQIVHPPDGYIVVYEEFLCLGLRFFVHPFFANVLDLYEVVSTQLTPNSIKILSFCVVLCHLLHFESRIFLFRTLFILKKHYRE